MSRHPVFGWCLCALYVASSGRGSFMFRSRIESRLVAACDRFGDVLSVVCANLARAICCSHLIFQDAVHQTSHQQFPGLAERQLWWHFCPNFSPRMTACEVFALYSHVLSVTRRGTVKGYGRRKFLPSNFYQEISSMILNLHTSEVSACRYFEPSSRPCT